MFKKAIYETERQYLKSTYSIKISNPKNFQLLPFILFCRMSEPEQDLHIHPSIRTAAGYDFQVQIRAVAF